MNIGILGAGTWGIALARMLELNGHDVTVWSVLPREIEQLEATRSHPNLPGIVLPAEIGYTTSMAEACRHKDIILFAVPSVFVRSTAEKAAPLIAEDQIIVDVAKGIEEGTLFTMTEVIADALVRATRCALRSDARRGGRKGHAVLNSFGEQGRRGSACSAGCIYEHLYAHIYE